MYIGGGSFGNVNLYFDRIKYKLVAVKVLLDLVRNPIKIENN